MLEDRSQIINVVSAIQRFDFVFTLALTRKSNNRDTASFTFKTFIVLSTAVVQLYPSEFTAGLIKQTSDEQNTRFLTE